MRTTILDEFGERRVNRWTDQELEIAYGLSEFLELGNAAIADFFRAYSTHNVRKSAMLGKLREARSQHHRTYANKEERDQARDAFGKRLRAFTESRKKGAGIGLKEAAELYPGKRHSHDYWSKDEKQLTFALRKFGHLRKSVIERILDDMFPGQEHVVTRSLLSHQSARESLFEGTTKQWLEERLGLSIEELKLLYGAGGGEHKRIWQPDEKIVLLGFQKYMGLPRQALAHFIEREMGRGTIGSGAALTNQVLRFRRERQEDVTREEFDAALQRVLEVQGKRLTHSEIRTMYSIPDAVREMVIQALKTGFFRGKFESSIEERNIQILRSMYVEGKSRKQVAQEAGINESAVNKTVERARELVIAAHDEENKFTIQVGPLAKVPNGTSFVRKPSEVSENHFDRYEQASKGRGAKEVMRKIISVLEEKPDTILPITVKCRYANVMRGLRGHQRMFDFAEVVLEVLDSAKEDEESTAAMKDSLRGVAYWCSRSDAASKLFTTLSRTVAIDGVSIIINLRENGRVVPVHTYRQSYLYPKAFGRLVEAKETAAEPLPK
jgi:hypothetical protein